MRCTLALSPLVLLVACSGREALPPPPGPAPALVADVLHHRVSVKLDPAKRALEVKDTLTLSEALRARLGDEVTFSLHAALEPELSSSVSVIVGAERGPADRFGINESGQQGAPVPLEHYTVTLAPGQRSFTLRYRGEIFHPLTAQAEEQARGMSYSPGLIGPEGAVLSGATHWLPYVSDDLVTFTLEAEVPPAWDVVSQGSRIAHERDAQRTRVAWDSPEPQDEVFLVAGPFVERSQQSGRVLVQTFLRSDDAALSEKYLTTGEQYLAMYEKLLGPYPYGKLAVVENFWETGYGMPSFTLLGPKILRFPFILHSSYPHEILHNWWGNGVYVEYERGNWSEGLTAYLADHLVKEQRGQGAEYRRTSLQKYADYVAKGADFPVREFRARHSDVTAAVGYDKVLMVFHMLRLELGDERFVKALRAFYAEHRHRAASFDDLAEAFGEAAGADLGPFFAEWLERSGAPSLRLEEATVTEHGGGFALELTLAQTQEGEPFDVEVPVAVTTSPTQPAAVHALRLREARQRFSLAFATRPVRVDVDPELDVFRRLDAAELPPSLSGALGAEDALAVLPAQITSARREAYSALATALGATEVVNDDTLAALPAGRSVWLLGWDNRLRAAAAEALQAYGATLSADDLRSGETTLTRQRHLAVAVARSPADPAEVVVFLGVDGALPLPGLGRKLPHYGKYSLLGFEGEEPQNVAKDTWPVVGSPLTSALGAAAMPPRAPLPVRRALAELPPPFSAPRLKEDLRALAAPERGGRGFDSPELASVAEWIAAEMKAAGLAPVGESYLQPFAAEGGEPSREATLNNVVGVIAGGDPSLAAESVVVGAHYDHLGLGWPDAHAGDVGQVHPGADDNASGVAVLLELGRVLAKAPRPRRSVVFVAFAGEEAGLAGSRAYAAAGGPYAAKDAVAMLNLDTVGRLGDGKLLALGAASAREWVHLLMGAGYVAGVEVQAVDGDPGGSDQVSFAALAVPAIQLTTGAHADYHRPSDTLDKVDVRGLVKVAAVAHAIVEHLAERKERLSVSGAAAPPSSDAAAGERKVSLGVVPDFAYEGPGVRITGAVQGSPAEAAGLAGGDVVSEVGGTKLESLRTLAQVLAAHAVGDEVRVVYRRDGALRVALIELVAR